MTCVSTAPRAMAGPTCRPRGTRGCRRGPSGLDEDPGGVVPHEPGGHPWHRQARTRRAEIDARRRPSPGWARRSGALRSRWICRYSTRLLLNWRSPQVSSASDRPVRGQHRESSSTDVHGRRCWHPCQAEPAPCRRERRHRSSIVPDEDAVVRRVGNDEAARVARHGVRRTASAGRPCGLILEPVDQGGSCCPGGRRRRACHRQPAEAQPKTAVVAGIGDALRCRRPWSPDGQRNVVPSISPPRLPERSDDSSCPRSTSADGPGSAATCRASRARGVARRAPATQKVPVTTLKPNGQ